MSLWILIVLGGLAVLACIIFASMMAGGAWVVNWILEALPFMPRLPKRRKRSRPTNESSRIVKWAIEMCVKNGADFEKFLPAGEEHSARTVINACGRALTEVGIPNNLFKPEGGEG